MTDTGQAVQTLRSYLEHSDYLGAECFLDDLLDESFDQRIQGLVGTAEIAKEWGVSQRRVRQHLESLNDSNRRVGYKLGGSWFLERTMLDYHRPSDVGRPRKKS